MTTIETHRVVLRPFEEEDFPAFYHLYQNEAVCQYLLHTVLNEQESRQKFEQKQTNRSLARDGKVSYAVVEKKSGLFVGDLSAWRTEMPETIEIGFAFLPTFAGQGFATEAGEAFLDYLITTETIHRITAQLDARNQASAALCKRLGLRQEAHFLQDYWNKGAWTDTYVYAQLTTERKKKTQQEA